MVALGNIVGIHIVDKMRKVNIRVTLNLTDTTVQKVHETTKMAYTRTSDGLKYNC